MRSVLLRVGTRRPEFRQGGVAEGGTERAPEGAERGAEYAPEEEEEEVEPIRRGRHDDLRGGMVRRGSLPLAM